MDGNLARVVSVDFHEYDASMAWFFCELFSFGDNLFSSIFIWF